MMWVIRILFFLLFPIGAFALEPVTDKNWKTHPEIKKISVLVGEINDAKDLEGYSVQGASCKSGGDSGADISLSLGTNEQGTVMTYAISTSGDGTVGTDEFYYDKNEVLRFAYHTRGDNIANQVESRQYFDRKGNLLYTRKSPDYDQGDRSSEAIRNPKSDFEIRCKEEDDSEDSENDDSSE